MRRLLVLLTTLLAACQSDPPKATYTTSAAPAVDMPADPIATPAAVPVAVTLSSVDAERNTDHDTLHVAGFGVLAVRRSQAAAFTQLRSTDLLSARPDSLDNDLSQTGGRVRRQGAELIFQPKIGPAVVLRDFPTDSSGAPSKNNDEYNPEKTIFYHYWGALPKAHQWVVTLSFYEGRAVLLVDQRTGRRTNLWGRPAVSPDGRYLLSVNNDYAYDPNGLQLFRLSGAGPRLLGERILTYWAPVQARWSGPRTLLLEQEHQLPGGGGETGPLTYIEIALPPSR